MTEQEGKTVWELTVGLTGEAQEIRIVSQDIESLREAYDTYTNSRGSAGHVWVCCHDDGHSLQLENSEIRYLRLERQAPKLSIDRIMPYPRHGPPEMIWYWWDRYVADRSLQARPYLGGDADAIAKEAERLRKPKKPIEDL